MTRRHASSDTLDDGQVVAVKALRKWLRETPAGRQTSVDFPLRRGALSQPLSRQNLSSQAYFFPTRDPDVFYTADVSDSASYSSVRVFLEVASHVNLLLWSRDGNVDRWKAALVDAPQELRDAVRFSTNGTSACAGIDCRCEFPATASEQTDDILDRIAPFGRKLRQLVLKQFVSAQLTVFTLHPPAFPRPTSFSLDPRTLRRLGEFGISLSCQSVRASEMASG